MRQIALDTETTGLSPSEGHRIIEIGCVEIVDRRLTGNTFHCYLNPEREIESGAIAVHGITTEFLHDKPKFGEVANQLLEFVKESELIIHNAPFDVGFLDSELKLFGDSNRLENYCSVFDTLTAARQKHPGQKNSLDALCKRYSIDNAHRQLHGALLDAELLARVYLAMTGGQNNLFVESQLHNISQPTHQAAQIQRNKNLPVIIASKEELDQHRAFLELIKKTTSDDCLWDKLTE